MLPKARPPFRDPNDMAYAGGINGNALAKGAGSMAWILLVVAGLFEIVWATAMKYSEGFTRPAPTVVMIAFMGLSFYLLTIAMRTLPLGTAYAVWTGIGAAGAFVVGILFLGEAASAMRILAVILIVSGIALLKLASPTA